LPGDLFDSEEAVVVYADSRLKALELVSEGANSKEAEEGLAKEDKLAD